MRPSHRRAPSTRSIGTWRPSLATHWSLTATTPVEEAPFRRTTLATTLRPCMSMPGAPPRITSMRSTWLAGRRCRMDWRSSLLLEGREPSIRALPASLNPREPPPVDRLKPGVRLIMSAAVPGR